MSKEYLIKFIDSVVNGNVDDQKLYMSQYSEHKARELLGVQQKPTEKPVLSEAQMLLVESNLGDDIELDGNDVLVKGNKVARLTYKGDDANAQLFIITNDGTSIPVKDNDIEDLMRIIRHKFLGEK